MIRSLLILISDTSRQPWALKLAEALKVSTPHIVTGKPEAAAAYLAAQNLSPSHLVLDIGTLGTTAFSGIDAIAQHCEPETRVLAVGDVNDVQLYRGLLSRGVIDYLPMPAKVEDIAAQLTSSPSAAAGKPVPPAPATVHAPGEKQVIAFLSAASGDGASTAAINTAYVCSQLFNGRTVLVDMDYQFGMVAKQLDLQNQYGIREIFEFPDRGIDSTLIKRMVANYGKLHVITAPSELRYLPTVSEDAIRDLIATLKLSYDHIIFDLPHVWLPWVSAVCQQSTKIVLVAQLWLKSVSHAARLVRTFRELSIPQDRVIPVINRSGAKFKEAIEPKDFERVCGTLIRYTLANDIKSITVAEGSARTVMEIEASELSRNITRLTRGLAGLAEEAEAHQRSGGLLSLLSKKG